MRAPISSPRVAARRAAAALVASRRGSIIQIFCCSPKTPRPSLRAPISAKGTRVVFPAPGGAWSRTVCPGRTSEQICASRPSIGNWLKAVLPLDSRDEIHQAEQQQAADGANSGQQPNERADGNNKGGHKDFLKGRINSGLAPCLRRCCIHSHAFTEPPRMISARGGFHPRGGTPRR